MTDQNRQQAILILLAMASVDLIAVNAASPSRSLRGGHGIIPVYREHEETDSRELALFGDDENCVLDCYIACGATESCFDACERTQECYDEIDTEDDLSVFACNVDIGLVCQNPTNSRNNEPSEQKNIYCESTVGRIAACFMGQLEETP